MISQYDDLSIGKDDKPVNTTRETVLALLGTALFGKPLELPDDVDWQAVYREMQLHTVLALAANVVSDIKEMDETVRANWLKYAGQNMQRVCHILYEQQQAVQLLEEAGYAPVVLKGASAAQYYPEPANRAMGDVDLLLPGEAAVEAAEMLKGHGYRAIFTRVDNPRHRPIQKNGVKFELHSFFSMLADKQKAETFDRVLLEGLKERCSRECCGFSYPTLPDFYNGLVILEHANHHMIAGIGLRQMLDWMVFVDKVLDDACWAESFQPVLKTIGLEKYAMTIARMGQLYLGLRTDNRLWCQQVDEQICAQLLAFIMDNGNFGVKHGEKQKPSKVLADFSSIPEMFRSLQTRGCHNFASLIRRFPFLRPFAWLLRIGRLLVLGVREHLSPSTLLASFRESRRRVRLFHSLGVMNSRRDKE